MSKDYRQELGRFEIHTKMGKEKFLSEVARAWEMLYPAEAEWYKIMLQRLREVTVEDGRYSTGPDREMRVTLRVPAKLLLFIQRWIPDFARDSSDIELLSKVWCDLVRPCQDHRRRTRLFVPDDYESKSKTTEETETGSNQNRSGGHPGLSHNNSP